ncbi:MAG: ribosome-associated translation inhibitor RaiA [Actinomycetota bacterium]|nr:ribosome-associated translation inhibitor RaiA [Actinomycetota bacterium]
MDVRVHGKNLQINDRLREVAERKVEHATRFFDSGHTVADVEFSQEHNPRLVGERFRVQVTAQVAGQLVRVEGAAPDDASALDLAMEKFEQQLRRLKDRLITRSRTDEHKHLNLPDYSVEEDEEEAGVPPIVRVKQFIMKPMSAEEASLQMEMLGHNFFFFLNAQTDLPSVLYRRRDGSLGLIEPA